MYVCSHLSVNAGLYNAFSKQRGAKIAVPMYLHVTFSLDAFLLFIGVIISTILLTRFQPLAGRIAHVNPEMIVKKDNYSIVKKETYLKEIKT